MRTRVKICGLTTESDARAAAELGADAIGLVFYPPSPRAVEDEQGERIIRSLPPFVTSVGLFVDAAPAHVRAVLGRVEIDLLQFHGDESPEYCAGFGRPWIKAIRMREGSDLYDLALRYGGGRGLLLDTYDPSAPGGTGRRFDWSLIPQDLGVPIILAGGLTANNVAEAVRRVQPFGVDVSGGVESAKGIKDHTKMAAFLDGVRHGDESR